MISFRTQTESVASSLLIVAVLVAIGTAAWFSMPLPTPPTLSPRSLADAQYAVDKKVSDGKQAEADIATMIWNNSLEEVPPLALSKVQDLVKKHQLKLVAFRPQKPIEGQGLIQMSIGLSLDGSFPNTIQFVKDLETSDSKLAVTSVQIASADQASDHVTGTLNVAAFLRSKSTAISTGVNNVKKS